MPFLEPTPESFLNRPSLFFGAKPQVAWKSVGYEILLPIKIVLVGPMLPFPNFLREDPPPPFVAVVFAFYWSVLALILYYLLGKIKRS